MNREDAAKLWPIIKAWSEGEDLEYLDFAGKWIQASPYVDFTESADRYRIRPKPRTVTIAYNRDTIKVCWGDETPDLDGAKTITIELPE